MPSAHDANPIEEPLQPVNAALITQLSQSKEQFLGYLRKRLSDEQAAEDLLQPSLVRALEAGSALRDKDNLVAWFYRVLQNTLIDYYRHRAADQRKAEALERELVSAPASLPEEERDSVCRCMHGLLPGLHPAYAELVQRVDLRDEDPKEVASDIGITPNNLDVRLHRARQALKKTLERACGACAEHGCLNCDCRH
jgi:RNA polymerase sigma factor (sigma-70 family)